ncbi:hypothetical protein Tco_0596020 [Tanacetum coccineum]
MRTASTDVKPYQEDSSEFYLITGSIYTDQRGTVVFPMATAARRGRVRFKASCSYSTDIHKDIMKAQICYKPLPFKSIHHWLREDEFHDDNPPPPVTPTQPAPHTLSTIKLPILKKGEYDIWAMKMEHYVEHTDYPIWEVIQKGNGPVQVSTDTNGQIRVLPPKTTEEFLARERERKARTTLLMAIPEEHLAKFHKMTDSKEIWEAIKSRFRLAMTELRRWEYLLSQLEIHGVGVSTEDANQKFLRSMHHLPLTWSTLDHEDLEQVDEFDLEEMDLKWQMAMISEIEEVLTRRQCEGLQLMPGNQLALTRPVIGLVMLKVYEAENFALTAF